LAAPESARTGEWREGIGRLGVAAQGEARVLLQPYLDLVGPFDAAGRPLRYPGSPRLTQALLRSDDRAIFCELHAQDAALLRANLGRDRRLKVVEIDGYIAWNAYVPPKERRGLVLVDPPFESPSEGDRMREGLIGAFRKWATGIQALWYPIKDAPLGLAEGLRGSGLRRVLHVRFMTGRRQGLLGCGMIILNPPFAFASEAAVILPYLAERLSQGPGADYTIEWLAGE
jgi:23S rRNA (adenine2030-N6)-methyltransferase